MHKEGKNRHQIPGKINILIQVEATGPTQEGRQNQANNNRQGAGQRPKKHKSTKQTQHLQTQQESNQEKSMSTLSHQRNKDHLAQKWGKVRLK